ncbi:hypothetical protein KTT66_07960 [Lacticaseibacillus casei]|jgi:antitoxin component of MazEF toxin-antitoxin module|uniref:AbrB family transcriptional regulator n=1 Tax=Lacticaseibacillus huelsenbergensis TaxID=3035291 RepID=A0ABY8DTQ9_9LACO|nr:MULTISPECIES: hypothetical protein [Lacticaseibacillus]MDG3062120.1 hypothetical protein [Lacticaseibacillus sp. BCRC 81376]QVI36338.1 hypothetical protein KGS74_08720 [Lacticaseibacillus casei]QXG58139.1 hypothetical protein KTT66_07960 [Lacticaseibacillus casei]WFB40389.1 hypothetical protein LHUE1_001177 [Lacticaseibacillus huelsenbergensis]WFB42142.1 hypothetical protein LHUE2_000101 [Lacticaseibacillus huelsenbergensis]
MSTKQHQSQTLGSFTVKRTGNLLSLPIPAEAGVTEGQEYLLFVTEDGTLRYEPQRMNPWHTETIRKINFAAMKKNIGIASEEPSRGKEI